MTKRRQLQPNSEDPAGGPVPVRRSSFPGRLVSGGGPLRRLRRDRELDQAYRLAQYSANLTRLAGRIAFLRVRGALDGQHLRAAITAYDQTLLIAAADLGAAADMHVPLSPVDRLMLEAELTLAGLRWTNVERAAAPGVS